jgi:hypothetical protein
VRPAVLGRAQLLLLPFSTPELPEAQHHRDQIIALTARYDLQV